MYYVFSCSLYVLFYYGLIGASGPASLPGAPEDTAAQGSKEPKVIMNIV